MRWEYLTSRIHVADFDERLNSLGAEGWELVSAAAILTYEYRRDHYGDETNVLNAVRPEEWECVFKRRRRSPKEAPQ